MDCKYCGETVTNISGHLRDCAQYKTWFNETVTVDFLQKHYVEDGLSCNKIAKMLGLPSSTSINRAVTRYGLYKRGISESLRQQDVKQQLADTNIQRYGVRHNLCREHPSRKAWQQRLFDEEGITNVFQRESVKDKIAEAIRQSTSAKKGCRISTIHRKVWDWLRNQGYDCRVEWRLPGTRYWYDIRVGNCIIEVNGDLYHANPKIYKSTDIVAGPKYFTPATAQSIWDKDRTKNQAVVDAGYHLMVLWECDIRKNFDLVTYQLKEFLDDTSGKTETRNED